LNDVAASDIGEHPFEGPAFKLKGVDLLLGISEPILKAIIASNSSHFCQVINL
jgi:hypothetical protein